jgi:hypothetical protein
MATGKSEVVSVRVEPWIKAALQTVADQEMRSLANMVEVMVVAYCRERGIEAGDGEAGALAGRKVNPLKPDSKR